MRGRVVIGLVTGLALYAASCRESELMADPPAQTGQYTVAGAAQAANPGSALPVTLSDLSLSESSKRRITFAVIAAAMAVMIVAGATVARRGAGRSSAWIAAAAVPPAVASFLGSRAFMETFASGGHRHVAHLAQAMREVLYPLVAGVVASTAILVVALVWLVIWRRRGDGAAERGVARHIAHASAAGAIVAASVIVWAFTDMVRMAMPAQAPPGMSIGESVEAMTRRAMISLVVPVVIAFCFALAATISFAAPRERPSRLAWIAVVVLLVASLAAAAWQWSYLQVLATAATTGRMP